MAKSSVSRCGTYLGRGDHRRRGESVCDPCRLAWNERCKEYRRKAKGLGWKRPPRTAYDLVCERCGRGFPNQNRNQRFCSLTCSGINYTEMARGRTYSRELVVWVRPARVPAHSHGRYVWRNGRCRMCGKNFTTFNRSAVTCSPECGARSKADVRIESGHRRRARLKKAYREKVYRAKVFAADGYRCHLCGRMTDKTKVVPHPKAPTLDHVIPLSKGGTHEPSNVRTAHFMCNAVKSDNGGGEQFAIVL